MVYSFERLENVAETGKHIFFVQRMDTESPSFFFDSYDPARSGCDVRSNPPKCKEAGIRRSNRVERRIDDRKVNESV